MHGTLKDLPKTSKKRSSRDDLRAAALALLAKSLPSVKLGLTDEQREAMARFVVEAEAGLVKDEWNLSRHRSFSFWEKCLRRQRQKISPEKMKFNMSIYLTDCGTVGCIAGHVAMRTADPLSSIRYFTGATERRPVELVKLFNGTWHHHAFTELNARDAGRAARLYLTRGEVCGRAARLYLTRGVA